MKLVKRKFEGWRSWCVNLRERWEWGSQGLGDLRRGEPSHEVTGEPGGVRF